MVTCLPCQFTCTLHRIFNTPWNLCPGLRAGERSGHELQFYPMSCVMQMTLWCQLQICNSHIMIMGLVAVIPCIKSLIHEHEVHMPKF